MLFDKKHLYSVTLTIFSICILLTAGLISGCGDEGDPPTEMVTGNGDKTPDPDPDPTDPVVDPDPVEPPPAPVVSFKDDIMPILAQTCAIADCHDNTAARGLNLTTYDNFKKGGNSGPAFVAGDGNASLVVRRIDGGGMPPVGPPLNADQIQLFVDWINEGAENN